MATAADREQPVRTGPDHGSSAGAAGVVAPGPPARLHVLEGRQGGAVATLPPGLEVDVGNDVEDHVFLDVDVPDGERWRVSVRCTEAGLEVTPHSGETEHEGEALAPGETRRLDYGGRFRGGDVAFRIEPSPATGTVPDDPRVDGIDARRRAANDAGADGEAAGTSAAAWRAALAAAPDAARRRGGTNDERADEDVPEDPAGASRRRTWIVAGLGLAAALALGVGAALNGAPFGTGRAPSAGAASATDDGAPLRALLDAARPHGAVLERADDATATLRGSVPTRDALNELVGLAARVSPPPHVELQVDDEFAQDVEDVYRVHGVDAKVRMTGPGEAEVATASGDAAALDRIERALRDDMPTLGSLVRLDRAPAARPRPVVQDGDAGSRVVLVVDGSGERGGYLLTRDGSRYLVGSMLPSGHEIERIRGGTVFATRGGETVELRF